jgi:5-formyltetrahydrofolate cyclo-ligase
LPAGCRLARTAIEKGIRPESQESVINFAKRKRTLRERAHANRRRQERKDELSREIVARFMQLSEYRAAKTVMFYLDVRTEVRTRHDLQAALDSAKKIVVPWCLNGELELFHLENIDELKTGMYKILEPRSELQEVKSKSVAVAELDLIMVPGVAFDRRGARMGHGKGYYDKLLRHARRDAPLVAIAFECQLFAGIPTENHDIFMDKILTEKETYQGQGRS